MGKTVTVRLKPPNRHQRRTINQFLRVFVVSGGLASAVLAVIVALVSKLDGIVDFPWDLEISLIAYAVIGIVVGVLSGFPFLVQLRNGSVGPSDSDSGSAVVTSGLPPARAWTGGFPSGGDSGEGD